MAAIEERAAQWVLRGNIETFPNTPLTFRVEAAEVGNVQTFGDALRGLRDRHQAKITISDAFSTMNITTTPESWEKLKAGVRSQHQVAA